MILRTRGGTQQRVTFADLGIQPRPGVNGTAYATSVTMLGLPGAYRAIALAAEAVASLDLGVWEGTPPYRERVELGWQARLFRGPLSDQQTRFEFLETLESSMTARGNAFIWKAKDGPQVVALYALHPDQVSAGWGKDGSPAYKVRRMPGAVTPPGLDRLDSHQTVEVGREQVIHVRGPMAFGALLAPTPVELFRDKLAADLARQRHDRATYEQGMKPGGVFTFPAQVGPDQVKAFRDLTLAEHGGSDNWHKPLIMGGGASFAPVALTPADAQWVESQNLTIEDHARIWRVWASLLEGGRQSKPISPEHEVTRWFRYGLNPRLMRLEAALFADADLFGIGSKRYPWFDTTNVVRGDVITESTRIHALVQAGVLSSDEARALLGYGPIPDGSGVIPIVTPVGGGTAADAMLQAVGAMQNGNGTGGGDPAAAGAGG